MEKQQDALRTIGEVAEYVGVATHVLRFWEGKFSQIKPQKRRGRRYYRAEDITTIRTIRELLYDHGYTINGVKKFLKDAKNGAALTALSDGFKHDESGNIIANNEDGESSGEFGDAEKSALQQLRQGLVESRDKLKKIA